ncbi:hypothetical protein ACIBL3_25710 [Kribbella sp. NPDC050124]|uniref:hypothetical protein n=1 Tax=Kribbella sp. NPDC050124 TaxID=3364114 RepID=UPI00379895C5
MTGQSIAASGGGKVILARCRFLRVDPSQLPRIDEMTSNAESRLAEANDRAWPGEVAALEESLRHLRKRRDEAEQQLRTAGAELLPD